MSNYKKVQFRIRTPMYYNPEYGLGFGTPYVVNVDVKFQNRKKL